MDRKRRGRQGRLGEINACTSGSTNEARQSTTRSATTAMGSRLMHPRLVALLLLLLLLLPVLRWGQQKETKRNDQKGLMQQLHAASGGAQHLLCFLFLQTLARVFGRFGILEKASCVLATLSSSLETSTTKVGGTPAYGRPRFLFPPLSLAQDFPSSISPRATPTAAASCTLSAWPWHCATAGPGDGS